MLETREEVEENDYCNRLISPVIQNFTHNPNNDQETDCDPSQVVGRTRQTHLGEVRKDIAWIVRKSSRIRKVPMKLLDAIVPSELSEDVMNIEESGLLYLNVLLIYDNLLVVVRNYHQ